MASDADYSCLWWDYEFAGEYETAAEVQLCHHPLGKGFCDFVAEDIYLFKECPYYQPRHPVSDVEEEVRQYLEYTE